MRLISGDFFAALFLAAALTCAFSPARAATIQQQLPGGMPASADYLPADPAKPAILVLHGFLQTFEFMATRNIVNGLSALGYTVLAPNLSLGVPNRNQSMQCQAPHAHTFSGDMAEIGFWIDWLQQQGYRSVILVGHSWGSQHSLGYILHNPEAPVAAAIAISLVRTHQPSPVHAAQSVDARARLAEHDRSLRPYNLNFCREFMATPQSYLSYSEWDDAKVLQVLGQLQKRRVPVEVIVGGQDKRIDPTWLQELGPRVASLTVIEGANHFFSHVHEFDLNDELERILSALPQ